MGTRRIAAIAVTLVYVVWIAIAPYPDPTRSFMRLAGGDLAPAFWLGVVLVGMGGPLAVLVMAKRGALADELEDGAKAVEPAVASVDGSGTASAAPVAAKANKLSTANALWIALGCLVVGSVVLRIIMYTVATSVEYLIY